MNNFVKEIMNLIINNGYEVYIVGGYVRDYLLNKKSNDYDLCTNCNINSLKKILCNYKYTIKFNTVSIIHDEINIEITPYRKEIKYFNRKPIEYELVNDLQEDLYRRDFTINSICMDVNSNIIDLLNGKSDINKKIIRGIGDNNKKITEDPLRILRAFRFSATTNFDIEENLMKSIIINKELLRSLSYERKKEEIDKIIDIHGLDILKPVSDILDIDLSNIKYYKSKILTWINIDYLNKYCTSKKDKSIINSIKIMSDEGINNYTVYKYGLYISSLLGELYNIDTISIYNSNSIKSRKDINITSEEIIMIIEDEKYTEKYYELIEKAILNNDIKNTYTDIVNCIRKNMFKN